MMVRSWLLSHSVLETDALKKNFKYEASDEQIEGLKAISETCYQDITYGCKMAPLKNTRFGHYFGWWTGKDGSKKFYIDGEDEENAVCGCHATSSCFQSMFNSTCNCDAVFLPLWSSDEGKITNKESLPVRSFVYGGFISKQQEANITVGKLKCAGSRRSSEDKSISTTCSSLKQGGATQDAFYLTKDSSDDDLMASYCQMSKPGYSESNLNIESYGLVKGGANMVLNIVFQSHNYQSSRSTVTTCQSRKTFYKIKSATLSTSSEQTDEYEAFNSEEGTYMIPETGLYTITIGTFDRSCDPYYLIDVTDVHGKTTNFYKSEYTNTYTQWLAAKASMQIRTIHSSYVSSSSFALTIVKH